MKKIFQSMFTDKEWDADCSKICGWIMIIVGFVGFFMQKDSFQWLITTGASLIGIAKVKEG